MTTRTFSFLGTGTSVGVPMVGCDCPVCSSTDPRNNRYRCSVLIRVPHGNILIDTPPELRLQLLREKVGVIHAVLYTHYHADHLFGLDDLRPVARHLGHSVPLFCTGETEGKIRSTFSYAFGSQADALPAGWIPKLRFERIDTEPFRVLGEEVIPIPMAHAHFDVLGFRLGDVAYCTDVSDIPRSSWPRLENLRRSRPRCVAFQAPPGSFLRGPGPRRHRPFSSRARLPDAHEPRDRARGNEPQASAQRAARL